MKEPKDQFSDEWYEWRQQEDERQYHSQKLKKSQSHGDMGPPDTKAYDKCKEAELIGSTITNIGFSPAVGEGGFGIDYVTKDGVKKRILFGYTELGLWVEWSGNV